jgi:hypothetical protein
MSAQALRDLLLQNDTNTPVQPSVTELSSNLNSNAQAASASLNPFGQAPVTNPFGPAPVTNPFGEAPVTNPFGEAPVTNPFGPAPVTNPFGEAPVTNPFGPVVTNTSQAFTSQTNTFQNAPAFTSQTNTFRNPAFTSQTNTFQNAPARGFAFMPNPTGYDQGIPLYFVRV